MAAHVASGRLTSAAAPADDTLLRTIAQRARVLPGVQPLRTVTAMTGQRRRKLLSSDDGVSAGATEHSTPRLNLYRSNAHDDGTRRSIVQGIGAFALISNMSECEPYEGIQGWMVQASTNNEEVSVRYGCAPVGDRLLVRQMHSTNVSVYSYNTSWTALSEHDVSCLAGLL